MPTAPRLFFCCLEGNKNSTFQGVHWTPWAPLKTLKITRVFRKASKMSKLFPLGCVNCVSKHIFQLVLVVLRPIVVAGLRPSYFTSFQIHSDTNPSFSGGHVAA
jgi:hypothetical protein